MSGFKNEYFIKSQLPPSLSLDSIREVLGYTSYVVDHLNLSLTNVGAPRLSDLIQRNNFSGIVSNILTGSFDRHTDYRNNSDSQYPDLIGPTGLEIKCTVNSSKGGESHNGHAGWHMIASYELIDNAFVWTCIKFADLSRDDWKYCGSQENQNGSRRTETYTTTSEGRSKLLNGICYLDRDVVSNWSRWRGLSPEVRNRIGE